VTGKVTPNKTGHNNMMYILDFIIHQSRAIRIAILVAVGILLFLFITQPLINGSLANFQTMEIYRQQILDAKNHTEIMQQLQARQGYLQQQIGLAERLATRDMSRSQQLTILKKAARQHSLVIRTIKPFETGQTETPGLVLDMYGTYHQVGGFLHQLESNLCIIGIYGFLLESMEDKSGLRITVWVRFHPLTLNDGKHASG
jgi:hypothetical protein